MPDRDQGSSDLPVVAHSDAPQREQRGEEILIVRKTIQRRYRELDLHHARHAWRRRECVCTSANATNLGVEDDGQDGEREKQDGDKDRDVPERRKRLEQSVNHDLQRPANTNKLNDFSKFAQLQSMCAGSGACSLTKAEGCGVIPLTLAPRPNLRPKVDPICCLNRPTPFVTQILKLPQISYTVHSSSPYPTSTLFHVNHD